MTEKTTGIAPRERLNSLDALRGFAMFWIVGGAALVGTLTEATDWGWLHIVDKHMHHVHWNGLRFFDLIFPLFMFISGIAIPFAITAKLEKGVSEYILVRKIFSRMLLLIVFGLVYNRVLRDGFSDMRAASVLGQIGIAYFFSALIIIYTRNIRTRIFWLAGILIGIVILQLFVPVPGYGSGVLTPAGSINAWIDQRFLPGKLLYGSYDPEGILCIVSATSITLMGTFAGNILQNKKFAPERKTLFLLFYGVVLTLIAISLHPVYPIIKNIWTVPFNIITAGISFILISLSYYIIDLRGHNKWTLFFKVIGLNSITIYLGARIIDFQHISEFFLGWLAIPTDAFGPVIIVVGIIVAEWLLLYYLYKNKIFLRV